MVRWHLLWLAACLAVAYEVQGQQAAVSGRGLLGEYFSGRQYEKKVFTRIDPKIDFAWFDQAPGPGMPVSYFSIRWTGKLYAPVSGKYTFTAEVDDGIRLWVGGKKLIDDWELNNNKTLTGSIILTAGQYYDLRIDYFNDMLEGEIKVYWVTPKDANTSNPSTLIPAQYLFQPRYTPPQPTAARTPVPGTTTNSAKPATPTPLPAKVATRTPRPDLPAPKPQQSRQTKPADTVTVKSIPPPAVAETFEGLKAGEAVVLRNVFFEQSQYRLLPESHTELDKLVKTLKKYPAYQIEISGHTDNVGDPRLNLTLSEYRAKIVANYLTRHGIDAGRLDAKGYGSTRPVADNLTEEQRAKNRRVEFVVK